MLVANNFVFFLFLSYSPGQTHIFAYRKTDTTNLEPFRPLFLQTFTSLTSRSCGYHIRWHGGRLFRLLDAQHLVRRRRVQPRSAVVRIRRVDIVVVRDIFHHFMFKSLFPCNEKYRYH